MSKAYGVIVRNEYFGNNSGKYKPIGMKFYRETQAGVARSPANVRRTRNGAEKRILFAVCFYLSVGNFQCTLAPNSLFCFFLTNNDDDHDVVDDDDDDDLRKIFKRLLYNIRVNGNCLPEQ